MGWGGDRMEMKGGKGKDECGDREEAYSVLVTARSRLRLKTEILLDNGKSLSLSSPPPPPSRSAMLCLPSGCLHVGQIAVCLKTIEGNYKGSLKRDRLQFVRMIHSYTRSHL